jgi:cytochrome c-type biogenesis protein CcmE
VKLRTVVPVLIAVAALGWVGVRGVPSALAYYLTPSELLRSPSRYVNQQIRLGGFVVPGSLQQRGSSVWFELSDGTDEVRVEERAGLPPLFREGSGAVAEGTFGTDGVFHSDDVLVKHDGVYRVPTSGAP